MSFVSYAQNFEDLYLWRALADVTAGFYIDVGGYDPDEHSVTRAFYDRGWRGITLEPVPSYHARFVAARPRDLNLMVAAGAAAGSATFYELAGSGLSTLQADNLANAARQGFAQPVERTVEVVTLDALWDAHVSGPVHFLKVDVEGHERAVLEGLDLTRHRPWIVVVEATRPNSPELAYADWEPLLTTNGYGFAWFDGLNRYYVAHEHAERARTLAMPPNVFDEWQVAATLARRCVPAFAEVEARLEGVRARAAAAEAATAAAATAAATAAARREAHLRARAGQLEGALAAAGERVQQLQNYIDAVQVSTSWRLTAPVRALRDLLRPTAAPGAEGTPVAPPTPAADGTREPELDPRHWLAPPQLAALRAADARRRT